MLKSIKEKQFKHSPWARADNPLGQNVSFQPLTLYTTFHDLINVYSRRSGADNRNLLSLRSFAITFKKISLKSDFIHFFHDFIHVYRPGTGADNPLGIKF